VPPRARSIAVVFAANGLGALSFLARLPERQADLDLSDGQLGLALVGLSLGALVASPLAGRLVGKLGSRSVVVGATVTLGGCLALAGAAPTAAVLFAALALVGAADAAMDIAMNANGAAYEDLSGRSVMHRLHAAWSVGALVAAGVAAMAAAAGVPLTLHLAAAGALLLAAVVATRAGLVADSVRSPASASTAVTATQHDGGRSGDAPAAASTADAGHEPGRSGDPGEWDRSPEPRERRSRGGRRLAWPLLVLAVATAGGAVIEGAPTDWGAIQLERYGTGEGVAALAVAAFMAGMLAGRVVGDWLTDRLGAARLLRIGTSLVAGGIVLGAVVGHAAAFLPGLFLAGLGAAGFFPLAFSAAARTPGVSPGAGAATVALAARIGFIAEPVLIGAISDAVGLRWAFGLVAAIAVALAVTAPRIVPAGARLTPAPTADPHAP
jgi:MFS family permease